MVIRQGEMYRLRYRHRARRQTPRHRRPGRSLPSQRNQHAVVAAITSNLRLGEMPGNVRLRKGEGGLPQASVVNVSQLRTVDRSRLSERIGAVGDDRMAQILRGLALVLGIEIGEEVP
jgi:mRNA interferase MazF